MAFQITPPPSFEVKVPDITGELLRAAQLKSLLSENSLRQSLAPLQIQEQEAKSRQAGIQTQEMELEQQSQKAMVAAWSDPEFPKKITGDGTNAESSGLGFDADAMSRELISRGVLPKDAMGMTQEFIKRSQTIAETQKAIAQTGEANAAQRTKGMKVLGDKIGSILDLPMSKAGDALAALKQDLVRNPKAYAGVPQEDLAHVYAADLEHLPAMANLIGLESLIADFHKSKQEAINATPEGKAATATAEAKAKLGVESSPQALALAGAKAGAEEAARFPYQARLEQMRQQGDSVYAFDPQTKQTIQTSRADALSKGYTNLVKVNDTQISNDKARAMQLGDAQMNISAYRMASQKMDALSGPDIARVGQLLGDSGFKAHFLGAELPSDWMNALTKENLWQKLPPDAQEAVIGYLATRPAAISMLRAINPGVRLNESQIKVEMANIPDPTLPGDVREKMFDRIQRNLDQAASTIPVIPGTDRPSDIRARVESQMGQRRGKVPPSRLSERERSMLRDLLNQ